MTEAPCPVCAMEVPADEAATIAVDMEIDIQICLSCGRTFSEARQETEEEEFDHE